MWLMSCILVLTGVILIDVIDDIGTKVNDVSIVEVTDVILINVIDVILV